MRARLISPDFWTDERVLSVSDSAKLLFEALWALADREGRLEDKPFTIALKARPWDLPRVPELLEELLKAQLVVRYEVEGVKVLFVPGFLKHQKPHVREKKSTLPPPPTGWAHPRPALNTVRHAQGEPPTGQENLPLSQQGLPAARSGEPRWPVRDPVGVRDPESESVSDPVRDQGAPETARPPPTLEKLVDVLDRVYVHNHPSDSYPWSPKDKTALRELASKYPPQLIVAKWLDATSPKRESWPRIARLVELHQHWTQISPDPRVVAQFDKDFAPPAQNVVHLPSKKNGGGS